MIIDLVWKVGLGDQTLTRTRNFTMIIKLDAIGSILYESYRIEIPLFDNVLN